MRGPVLSYALSVHGFINKIGNDAGFAAIIAVALVIIMVFVQARETSLVRDRAQDAEDRLAQLEQYAAQVGRQATAAQQAAQAAGAQATQAASAQAARAGQAPPGRLRAVAAPTIASRGVVSRSAAVAPFAPFGVGAPALSSATRLIPRSDVPVVAAPALATTPAPVAVAPAPASVAPVPIPVPVPALAPSTAAAGSPMPPSMPPSMPLAPSSRAPRRDYGGTAESEPRVGRGSLAIAAILIIVIVVAAVLVITHHSSSSTATRSADAGSPTTGAKSARSASSQKSAKTVRVNPTQVRVAVLNGTATSNLAADVSTKLNKVGFQQGETANFSNPDQASTTVGYLPGDRAQGIAVAKALGIGASSVTQVSTMARQIVCPSGAAACADQIVVTVGADLNSDA
jgi:hypothetical protein